MVVQCSPRIQNIKKIHAATMLQSSRDPQKFVFGFRKKTLHYVPDSLNFLLLNLLRENQWYKRHTSYPVRRYFSKRFVIRPSIFSLRGVVQHRLQIIMASDLRMVFQERYFFMKAHNMLGFMKQQYEEKCPSIYLLIIKHYKSVYLRELCKQLNMTITVFN